MIRCFYHKAETVKFLAGFTLLGWGGTKNFFLLGPEPAVGGPLWGGLGFGPKAVHFGYMVGQIGSGQDFHTVYILQFSRVSLRGTNASYSCSSTDKTKNLDQECPTCSPPGCVIWSMATF
jgi:hypothetical protein